MPTNYINSSSITLSEIELFLAMSNSSNIIIDMNCCSIFAIFNMDDEIKVVYWDSYSMNNNTNKISKILPKILIASCGHIKIIPCVNKCSKISSIGQGTYHYVKDSIDELAINISEYVKQSIINTFDCNSSINNNEGDNNHPILPSPSLPSINLYNVLPPCC